MADQTLPQQPQSVPTPAPSVAQLTPKVQMVASVPVSGSADQDEKFFAALGYFGPLFLLTLIVKPNSAYCKFHAKQSMVLFGLFVFGLIVLFSLPWFGSLLNMGLFALYIIAIYRAYKGDLWAIPIVSKFAGKVDLNAMYGKAGLAISGVSQLKEKAQVMATQAASGMEDLGKQDTDSTVSMVPASTEPAVQPQAPVAETPAAEPSPPPAAPQAPAGAA